MRFIINRRRFIQLGAGTAMFAWTYRAFPYALSPTGIKKFMHGLPGLTADGANDLGNYIPLLTPITRAGIDNYLIKVVSFKQQVHSALPETTFFGYAEDRPNSTTVKYLGGVIVAKRGTPVRARVTNFLPPMHILPNDITLIDPASGEAGFAGRTDRIAVHLHGGFLFWNSDGGPFSWYSNPRNPGGYVTGSSFMNAGRADGIAVYNYPNDQSARTMWYHDHAYGLTRTNVYAGLATAYLITDDAETALVSSGVIPSPPLAGAGGVEVAYPLGIPLIVQDKTFWDGLPDGSDPDYASSAPGAVAGSLWYPHVYEGAEDPDGLPSMLYSDLPANPKNIARWGATPFTGPDQFPPISSVPEFFSDTILVNGTPYPTVNVESRRYRFRFLNTSNARFYNLQLFVADNTSDGITLAPIATGELDNNDNPILVPTNDAGPAFIQIANEAGFLPAPAIFSAAPEGHFPINLNSNRPIGYIAGPAGAVDRRADAGHEEKIRGHEVWLAASPNDPTIGNVNRYNLLMAPAERPDVIIDFRGFEGKKLILYNDAPAPFPGGDIRNDYFVGNPANGTSFDLTSIGGAPSTKAGFGPDTRILMQFVVGGAAGTALRVDTGAPTTGEAPGWTPNNAYGRYGPFTPVDLSSAQNPAPAVVYEFVASAVRKATTINYPLTGLTPDEEYTVRLHFMEVPGVTARERVCDISINGTVVRSNFDIVAASGGTLRAYSVDFTGINSGSAGSITISLAPVSGTKWAPSIAGIELLPSSVSNELSFADTVAALQDQLPTTFRQTQPDPASLVPTAANTFIKTLVEDNDDFGRLRQLIGDSTGNPKTYLDYPTELANEGDVQRWQIYNLTADSHPMHFHLVNVAVRSRQQWAFNAADGTPVLPLQVIPNTSRPPDANEMGWKETVRANPGEVVTVDMQFVLPTGTPPPPSARLQTYGLIGAEYVWHCHILEHEEHDMMRPTVVLAPGSASTSTKKSSGS